MARRFAIATLLVGLVVLGGLLLERMVLSGSATPTPPLSLPAPRVVAQKITGTVVRASGKQGQWSAVHAGDLLSPDDSLRTADGASAVLALGSAITLQVDPETEVRVGDLAETTSRLDLAGGRIDAEVAGGAGPGPHLEVSFRGSDAVAESGPGRFSAISAGDGHVVVASRNGSVELRTGKKRVTLNAGEQSRIDPGAAPSVPEKVPPSLFLKLAPPAAVVQREKQIAVRGDSTPGALVTVNGVRTVVSAEGHFEASVPLKEGVNAVEVRVRSVDGRTQSAALPPVTVDSKPLVVHGQVDWK